MVKLDKIDKKELIDGDGFQRIAEELGIVYCETHDLSRHIDNEFVLAHNSDGCILPPGVTIDRRKVKRNCDFNWENIPEKLKLLFAINVDVTDRRIVPLPVGLERERWFPHLRKKEKLLELMKLKHKPSKLVYLNIDPRTNIYSRPQLIKLMLDKPWCTFSPGRNGIRYNDYIAQIHDHKFVFSPDGNCFEAHRTWEALYLGAIPIVERHKFIEEFAQFLPILIVDSWEEVNEDFLNTQYENLRQISSGSGTRGGLNLKMISNYKIPIPYPDNYDKSMEEQQRIVSILDKFDTLTHSISEGLPKEIELRQKQYEYYRDLLLSFPKAEKTGQEVTADA
jgi:hypothetical protein